MKPGMRYIVTKASDDETFQIGDHIRLEPNGAILCIEALGWVDAADVPAAIVGMQYEPDRVWAQRKLAEAERMMREYA
jgi:hypothetical protein